MTLERTGSRQTALRMVCDGKVRWRQSTPAGKTPVSSAGFAHTGGGKVRDLDLLISLCELEDEKLIVRRDLSVRLTDAGRTLLAAWDVAQVRS